MWTPGRPPPPPERHAERWRGYSLEAQPVSKPLSVATPAAVDGGSMDPRAWTAETHGLLGAVAESAWDALSRKTVEVPGPPDLDALGIADPDAWLATRRADSRRAGVWECALERIERHHDDPDGEAILFLHGFGATRAEGEATLDPLARRRGANVYYARLPGHGMTMDAHARATPHDYWHGAAEALAVARLLGRQLTLVGSSTGALLATWLAASYADEVKALVVSSPFFAFQSRMASALLGSRAAPLLARLAFGEVRDATWDEDPRCVEGYNEHWLVYQRPEALIHLEHLRRATATPRTFSAISAPVLQLVYHKSDTEQDAVVSVEAADAAYGQMNGGTPHGLSRSVRIADGAHILLSEWVHSDKAAVLLALEDFLSAVHDDR